MTTPEAKDRSAQPAAMPAFQLPYLREFIVLLVAWVLFFQVLGNSTLGYVNTSSLFGWWRWTMNGILDQDQVLLAYIAPLAVVGLIYHRRGDLAKIPLRVWWPSILVVMAALCLHVLGFIIQQARVSVLAFSLGVYGITGVLWGWRWLRATLLPFSLLAFCVPLGSGVEAFTFPLRLLASTLTAVFCHAVLGIDVIQRGNLLFDAGGHFQYEVAAACSGIRSLSAVTLISIVYAYLNLKSVWRIGVMLAAAVPLAVIANAVRLIMIISAAEVFGQKTGDMVHASGFFSMVPYVPALIGVVLIGGMLRAKDPLKGLKKAKASETSVESGKDKQNRSSDECAGTGGVEV